MRFRRPLHCALAALLGVCAAEPATAQSLWQQRKFGHAFLFYDTQARQVGDLLTVLIRENTDVDNRDQRELDREVSGKTGFALAAGLGGGLGSASGEAALDSTLSAGKGFDGSSQYTVERDFTDRITVCVVDVLPNGNLVIHGERNRLVSNERRMLTLSGIVRPIDVGPDNTVESRFIGNFTVCYRGAGDESEYTKEGWLTRAWNKVRPL